MKKHYVKREKYEYVPRATKFIELAPTREDNKSNFSIAKDRKFVSFLEQTIPSFREGDLPVNFILYPLKLNSSSSHIFSL